MLFSKENILSAATEECGNTRSCNIKPDKIGKRNWSPHFWLEILYQYFSGSVSSVISLLSWSNSSLHSFFSCSIWLSRMRFGNLHARGTIELGMPSAYSGTASQPLHATKRWQMHEHRTCIIPVNQTATNSKDHKK